MRAKIREKREAKKLRAKGWTIIDISQKLKIAKSSCFNWVKNVELSEKAVLKLIRRKELSRIRGRMVYGKIRERRNQLIQHSANRTIKQIKLNRVTRKLLCALLYWGEGEKRTSAVAFSNSDPNMVKTFLALFRSSFPVKEDKFRALLHLHEYHNQKRQRKFWASITKIPPERIYIYNKPNSGKNTHPGYPGCISVRYYDVRLAREIEYLYTKFITHLGA